MTNILTVLAHGLGGAGIEKNSIEFTEYVNNRKSSEYHAEMLSNCDIKWPRGNAHKHNAIELSFTKQFDDVKRVVDRNDIVIVMCMPFRNTSDEVKLSVMAFMEYAKQVGKKTCFFQLDHTMRSLRNNMYTEPQYYNIFKNFDIIFNHSWKNDFILKFIDKEKIEHNKIICRGDYGIENLFAIDFDKLHAVSKPFEQKEYRTVKFIGRSSGWKGPWKVRDFHYNHLMKEGYITSLEGIEMSIGTLADVYSQIKPTKIVRQDVNLKYVSTRKDNIKDIETGNFTLERNNPAYIMPPYNHDSAMERLSRCQFGIELLNLKDHFLFDTIENAMFEHVATGCIPIFRKKWADSFTLSGKSVSQYSFEESGTILVDDDNQEEALKLMNMLSDNKEAYDKARQNAYSFYKKYFDVKPIYDKIIDVIMSN